MLSQYTSILSIIRQYIASIFTCKFLSDIHIFQMKYLCLMEVTAGQYIVLYIRDTKALDVCMFLRTTLSEHSFFEYLEEIQYLMIINRLFML